MVGGTLSTRSWWILGTGLLAINLHVLLSVVQAYLSRRKQQRNMKPFPGPTPHWLLGNGPEARGPGVILKKNVEWTGKYGDAFATWLSFSYNILRLTGPDTVQTILSTSEPKDPIGYKFLTPWIGDGLLMSKGKKWARNRRLLTPAFHFDILKPYVTIFSKSSSIMLDKWQEKAQETGSVSLEMFQNISLMTLDSLMKCIFGVHDQDIQTRGRHHPYIQSVYQIAELAVMRFRFPPYHNDLVFALSPAGFRFRRQLSIAHKFTRDVIDMKQKEQGQVNKAGQKNFSFLEILLDCKDADGQGLSYQEICDEVDTFMFEGHDTTASGISWFLYNLARHPEIQQKCREEVNRVLGDKEHVDSEDMPKLEYLTQCLKESMRIHPPVPAIGRRTTKPLTLPDGRQIAEGQTIGVSIYACHHNDRVWKDPEVYDPERFNVENSKNRHPHAFIPFSAGPRNCIGQHFAYNEMKTSVAQLLRRFSLSLDDSKPPPIMVTELVLRAKEGLWLKCTPISSA